MTEKNIFDAIKSMPQNEPKGHLKTQVYGKRADFNPLMKDEDFYWNVLNSQRIKKISDLINPNSRVLTVRQVVSHTDVEVPDADNPGKKMAGHILTFFDTRTDDRLFDTIKQIDIEAIAKSVDASAIYLWNASGKQPLSYQLFGAKEKQSSRIDVGGSLATAYLAIYDMYHGLGRNGPQTVGDIHIHTMLVASEPTEIKIPEPEDQFKYTAPISSLFNHLIGPISESILNEPVADSGYHVIKSDSEWPTQYEPKIRYDGKVIISEVADKNNPTLKGISIHLENSTKLSDYLKMTYILVAKLNNIYKYVMDAYSKWYTSAEPDKTMTEAIQELTKMGLTPELAKQTMDMGKAFQPTFKQVINWLNEEELDDKVRQKLEHRKANYLKAKERNSDPAFIQALIKREGRQTAELMLRLSNDQLSTAGPEVKRNVLTRNVPLKIIFDDFNRISGADDKLAYNDVKVFFLPINSGNAAENKSGFILKR